MGVSFKKSNKSVKKLNFFKRFYKEVIVVVVGILIGSSIGGAGKVVQSTVDEVNMQIESNIKDIESKKIELETLKTKKIELEANLEN